MHESYGTRSAPALVPLTEADLQPGDVLLSRGSGSIADAIVNSDEGSYSHAALWTGSSVVEAVLDGICEQAITCTRDVYRHRGVQDAGLPLQAANAACDFARRHVGLPYACSELLLLGALYSSGIRPTRPVLDCALQLLGGPTASKLSRLLETLRPSREPMICSELVARAFYEADVSRAYGLRVLPRHQRPPYTRPTTQARGASGFGTAPLAQDETTAELGELSRSCERLLGPFGARPLPLRGDRKILFGAVAFLAGDDVALGHVTPGDIQFSPSLRYVGRIVVEPANH